MALSRVGADAALVLGARLLGAAANVAVVLILSRALPASEVGVVLTALACALLGELAVGLGREGVAIQVLPQARPGVARAYLASLAGLARRTAPLAALGAGLACWLLTRDEAGWLPALTTAALVPLGAFVRIASRLVHATGRIAESAALFTLARPLLLAVGVATLGGVGALSAGAAVGAAVLAAALTAGVQAWRARLALKRLGSPDATVGPGDPAWARSGRSLFLTSLLLGDLPGLVTVVAAVRLGEAEVAVLGVALRFAALLTLGSGALIAALGPRVSGAWGRGERAAAVRLGRAIPRVAVPVVGAGVLTAWLAAPLLLGLFGEAYRAGAPALRLLVLMPLLTACVGPSLLMLTAAGRAERAGAPALAAAGAVCLGTLVGAGWGVTGAAVGVVLGHALWEVTLARRLWRSARVSLWLPFGPRRAA